MGAKKLATTVKQVLGAASDVHSITSLVTGLFDGGGQTTSQGLTSNSNPLKNTVDNTLFDEAVATAFNEVVTEKGYDKAQEKLTQFHEACKIIGPEKMVHVVAKIGHSTQEVTVSEERIEDNKPVVKKTTRSVNERGSHFMRFVLCQENTSSMVSVLTMDPSNAEFNTARLKRWKEVAQNHYEQIKTNDTFDALISSFEAQESTDEIVKKTEAMRKKNARLFGPLIRIFKKEKKDD